MKTSMFTKVTAGITLSLVASTMLHATNGDTLIAVGAKARGMGGTGIAVSHGAESTISNPAMITSIEGTEISFGGTVFMPTIKTEMTNVGNVIFTGGTPSGQAPGAGSLGEYTSDADMNMIPEVSIAHKINDNWYIGIGMWGTAGMGVDFSKAPAGANMNMVTNLQLMQFAVPVAYKADGFSVAVAPILQYGNLDINYNFNGTNVGSGLAQDFGFGWSAGLAYEVSGFTIGAVYKSSIKMNYDGQLSSATAPFVAAGAFPAPMSDTLEQPAEYGIGLAYEMGQHTFAFDWKRLKYSSADGYKDFGWDDQDVYAFGYQYAQDNWAIRLGYNHGSTPVTELDATPSAGAAMGANSAINTFNLLGFPATAENHYTIGGTYEFTNQFSLDLAYVYSPSNTETFNTPMAAINPNTGNGMLYMNTTSVDHSESSLSFQLTYAF